MRTLEHLSLKSINRQNAKTALQGQKSRPAEPLSLKSVHKRLYINTFTKRNCTPFNIRIVSKQVCSYGGEGETRTLAPVTRPTPLAGAPRHQLEYFSMVTLFGIGWRREWDSNPRYPQRYDGFQDRSVITTSVSLRTDGKQSLAQESENVKRFLKKTSPTSRSESKGRIVPN